MSTAVSKVQVPIRSSNAGNPAFPSEVALDFHRENGRFQLCLGTGEPVLEIEPTGPSTWQPRPLANPGSGWLVDANGWPVIGGYTKNP